MNEQKTQPKRTGPGVHHALRLDAETDARVDRYHAQAEARNPGIKIPRAAALRALIIGGLDAAERAAVALPVDVDAKGGRR